MDPPFCPGEKSNLRALLLQRQAPDCTAEISRRMENMGLVLWDKMTVMAMPAATTESSARQARTRSGVRESEW